MSEDPVGIDIVTGAERTLRIDPLAITTNRSITIPKTLMEGELHDGQRFVIVQRGPHTFDMIAEPEMRRKERYGVKVIELSDVHVVDFLRDHEIVSKSYNREHAEHICRLLNAEHVAGLA